MYLYDAIKRCCDRNAARSCPVANILASQAPINATASPWVAPSKAHWTGFPVFVKSGSVKFLTPFHVDLQKASHFPLKTQSPLMLSRRTYTTLQKSNCQISLLL